MPQMFPLPWMNMYLFFLIIIFMTMILTYTLNKTKLHPKNKNILTTNPKIKW